MKKGVSIEKSSTFSRGIALKNEKNKKLKKYLNFFSKRGCIFKKDVL